MASPVQAGQQAEGHVAPGPGLQQFWPEIAGTLLLAAVTGIGWRYRHDLSVGQALVLGSLSIPALVLLARRGWLRLFGPVLYYDLVRVSRRSQYIWLRFFYAALLTLVLCWQYTEWVADLSARRARAGPLVTMTVEAEILAKSLTAFAERFFSFFMIVQFFLIYWLTPVYAASAVSEEKDRKTLEYLLATDLSSREIVLSKFFARLMNLCLIVLAGLPILGLLQFLGGIDPNLVLAGFVTTGISMISLTSLSILCSVYSRKSRDAILLTYLCVIAYLGIGYLLEQVRPFAALTNLPLIPGSHRLTFGDLVSGMNAGNLPLVLIDLQIAWSKGTPLTDLVADTLRGYAVCHGVIAAVCLTWAMLRFRSVSLSQTAARTVPVAKGRHRPRPRIAFRPMVWKEVFVEPGFRLTRMGWLVVAIFVLVSLVPFFWIGAHYLLQVQAAGHSLRTSLAKTVSIGGTVGTLGEHLRPWVRATSAILGALMLIGVAARASTSISSERDRETLDALLASPLQSHDILFAKWLGSLLSVRWAWLWLGAIWLIGMVTGAMHPLSVPLFAIAWLVYASCLAGIGLWFSTSCRTTLRSTMCTLGATVLLGGGHYVCSLCCLPLGPLQLLGNELVGLAGAFTPVSVFYKLIASPQQVRGDEWDLWAIGAYFGLFLWALAALALWTITRSRFRKITARMPYRRPEARRGLVRSGWGRLDDAEEWREISWK